MQGAAQDILPHVEKFREPSADKDSCDKSTACEDEKKEYREKDITSEFDKGFLDTIARDLVFVFKEQIIIRESRMGEEQADIYVLGADGKEISVGTCGRNKPVL